MAVVFSSVGAAIVLVAMGVIPVGEGAFHAPHIIVGLIGAAFMSIGALLLTLEDPSFGELPPFLRWMQYGALVIFMGSFSLVILWWGFLSPYPDDLTVLGVVTLRGGLGRGSSGCSSGVLGS